MDGSDGRVSASVGTGDASSSLAFFPNRLSFPTDRTGLWLLTVLCAEVVEPAGRTESPPSNNDDDDDGSRTMGFVPHGSSGGSTGELADTSTG